MRRLGLAVIAATLAAPSACTERPDVPAGTPEVVVRDSAGIEIVEIPAEAIPALPEWRLAESPSLSIGEVEGEAPYLFSRIVGAARFESGMIGVFERSTRDLRLFSNEGVYSHSLGGSGEGPGEFSSALYPRRIAGDRFAVFNGGARSVTSFDVTSGTWTDGPVVPAECPLPGEDGALSSCRRTALDGAGNVLLEGTAEPVPPISGDQRFAMPDTHLWLSTDEGVIWLDSVPMAPVDGVTLGQEGNFIMRSFEPAVFFPTTVFAAGARGLVTAHSHRYEVRFHDDRGALVRILRLDREPVPAEPAHLQALRDAIAANPNAIPNTDLYFDGWEMGDMLPQIERIVVDAMGRTWVADYEPSFFLYRSTPITHWTVFDENGLPRARATTSTERPTDILEIGDGYVLLTERDELDVQYLRLYEIVGTPSDAGSP